MSRRLVIQRPAQRDMDRHSDYIAQDNPAAARRVLTAIKKACSRIAKQPGLGSPYDADDPRLAGLRVLQTPRYKHYLIFYRVTDETVEIVRVIHSSMDINAELERESGHE